MPEFLYFILEAISQLCMQKNRWEWIKFKQALFIFTEIIMQGSTLFLSVIVNEESILGVADSASKYQLQHNTRRLPNTFTVITVIQKWEPIIP